jgi:hypothetical protein
MRCLRSPHSLGKHIRFVCPLINPGKWLLALLAYPQGKRVTIEVQLSPVTCQTAINGKYRVAGRVHARPAPARGATAADRVVRRPDRLLAVPCDSGDGVRQHAR